MIDAVAVLAAIGTILTAVVGTGVKKVWVWGWALKDKQDQLDDMEHDRNFWRDTALRAMGHADKAMSVAEKVAGA